MSEKDKEIETPEVEEKVDKTEKWDFIEINEESFNKLKEIEQNKSIALKLEREKASEYAKKLEEFENKEKELQQKEKIRKGKHEELIAELQESNKTLEEKAKAYDELILKQKEEKKAKLWELTEKLSAEIYEDNKIFLEELSDNKKILFLEKLLKSTEKKDFDIETNKSDKLWKDDELNKAKKEWDVMSILANAKTI